MSMRGLVDLQCLAADNVCPGWGGGIVSGGSDGRLW